MSSNFWPVWQEHLIIVAQTSNFWQLRVNTFDKNGIGCGVWRTAQFIIASEFTKKCRQWLCNMSFTNSKCSNTMRADPEWVEQKTTLLSPKLTIVLNPSPEKSARACFLCKRSQSEMREDLEEQQVLFVLRKFFIGLRNTLYSLLGQDGFGLAKTNTNTNKIEVIAWRG